METFIGVNPQLVILMAACKGCMKVYEDTERAPYPDYGCDDRNNISDISLTDSLGDLHED